MGFFKRSDKNKGGSSAPAENPYAASTASNYAPSVAPSYHSQDPNPPRNNTYGQGPAPPRNNSYGQGPAPQRQQQQGYGNNSYGASGGYGSNQYGNSGGYGGASNAGRGGYGAGQDNSRDQLMAGAKPIGSSYGGFQNNPYASNNMAGGAGGQGANGAANPYANQVDPNGMPGGRQPYYDLTQEEDPDEREVKQIGNQILQEKSATVDTTNRILALTSQIEAQGDNIMDSINRQEDMLDNYERNMDISNAKTRQAKAAVKDLATADHMFNFRTRGKRERELAEKTERDLMARQTEDETRAARHDRQRAYQEKMNQENAKKQSTFGRKPGNNKLSFDFDDEGFKAEDDNLEDQIDQNMDAIERAVGGINMKARMIGHQIEQSNQRLPGLTEKVSLDGIFYGLRGFANVLFLDRHCHQHVAGYQPPSETEDGSVRGYCSYRLGISGEYCSHMFWHLYSHLNIISVHIGELGP